MESLSDFSGCEIEPRIIGGIDDRHRCIVLTRFILTAGIVTGAVRLGVGVIKRYRHADGGSRRPLPGEGQNSKDWHQNGERDEGFWLHKNTLVYPERGKSG